MKNEVDVIIPTYRPDGSLRECVKRISEQTVRPRRIILINTERELFDEGLIKGFDNVELYHIPKESFDHGDTRNTGAGFASAKYIVFMTQDAMPYDGHLIENLRAPLEKDREVKAAYGRQLPRDDARPSERIVRSLSYPAESKVRTVEDLPLEGVKTFSLSDVCSIYDRDHFLAEGGFASPMIFNEDCHFAGRILKAGYKTAYAADAAVVHSHNYTYRQQFRRNFDNGVSRAMRPEVFGGLPAAKAGGKLVSGTVKRLLKEGHVLSAFSFVIECFFRFAGFQAGKRYRHLPKALIRLFTSDRSFWNKHPF